MSSREYLGRFLHEQVGTVGHHGGHPRRVPMEPGQWPGTLREFEATYSPHRAGRRPARAQPTFQGRSRAASQGSPSNHRRATSGSRRRAVHEDPVRPSWNPSTRLLRHASASDGGDPLYALLDENLRRAGFEDDYDDAVARFLARRRAARVRQIAEEEYQEAAAVWWYCTHVMPVEQRAALEDEERANRHVLTDDESGNRKRLQFLLAEATDALIQELWALEAAERAAAEHAALVAARADEEARERFVRKVTHLSLAEEELREQLLEHAETESFRIETTCLEERVEVAEYELRKVRHMVDEQTAVIRHEERCRAIIAGAYESQLDELLVVIEDDRTTLFRHLRQRLEEEEIRCRMAITKVAAASWDSLLGQFRQHRSEYVVRQALLDAERDDRAAITDVELAAIRDVWEDERREAMVALEREERAMRSAVAVDEEQLARKAVVFEAVRSLLYVRWSEARLHIVSTEADTYDALLQAMIEEEGNARTSVAVKEYTACCSRQILALQHEHQRETLGVYEAARRDRLRVECDGSWALILRSVSEHRSAITLMAAAASLVAAESDARRQREAEEEVERASLTGVRDADRSRLVRLALQHVVLMEEFDRADLVAGDEYFWRFIARMAEILAIEEEQRAEGRVVEAASREGIFAQASLSRQTALSAAEARARSDVEASSLNQLNALHQRCAAGADDLQAQLLERQRQAQQRRWKAALASPKKFIGITAVERVKERCLQIEAMHVGGPAHSAGAQLNDVLARVGGIPVTTRDDMRRAIATAGKMNEELIITLRRPPPPAESADAPAAAAAAPSSAKSSAAAAVSSGEEVRVPVRVMCTDREFSDVDFFFDPATPKISILDPQ